jgi:hypothetical protein
VELRGGRFGEGVKLEKSQFEVSADGTRVKLLGDARKLLRGETVRIFFVIEP